MGISFSGVTPAAVLEAADTAATSGWGALPVIAAVVVVAAFFLVGLLLGEQWHRQRIARREKQLATARRQVEALTRALAAREKDAR